MKMTRKYLVFLSLLVLCSAAVQAQKKQGWTSDYDKAVKLAVKQKKDLMVAFTGSDWCGACIDLEKRVFDKRAFTKAAKKKFVLVWLDYPRLAKAVAKVSKPKRNKEIAARYSVASYPTVILMTPQGDELARTGYREDGAKAYAAHLVSFAKLGNARIKDLRDLRVRAKKARGKDLEVIVREACTKLSKLKRVQPVDAEAPVDEKTAGRLGMADLVKRVFEVDPINAKGMHELAFKALSQSSTMDKSVMDLARMADPLNKAGVQERAIDAWMDSRVTTEGLIEIADELERVYALGFVAKHFNSEFFVRSAVSLSRHTSDQARAKRFAKKALESRLSSKMKKLMIEIVEK